MRVGYTQVHKVTEHIDIYPTASTLATLQVLATRVVCNRSLAATKQQYYSVAEGKPQTCKTARRGKNPTQKECNRSALKTLRRCIAALTRIEHECGGVSTLCMGLTWR